MENLTMNITMPGVENRTEEYRGYQITWQEPPMSGANWSANVATESAFLFALMRRNSSKVIQGRTRDDMLAEAKAYIDTLLDGARSGVQPSVHDLFVEAMAKKNRDVPHHLVRDYLIDRGHDIGHVSIDEVGDDRRWELTFQTGEKINFDGGDYHFIRWGC
jgi:hypothetical protein